MGSSRCVICGPIVRYVDQSTASVWVELDRPRAAMLTAMDITDPRGGGRSAGRRHVVHTVQVGGGHYALLRVTDLQPGRFYRYSIEHVDTAALARDRRPRGPEQLRRRPDRGIERLDHLALSPHGGPVFRTLPPAGQAPLHLAFGSCRKWGEGARGPRTHQPDQPASDALDLFAGWLQGRAPQQWPQMLLLLGDQIYADDVSPALQTELLRRRRALEARGPGRPVLASLTTINPPGSTPDGAPTQPAGIGGFHLRDFHELRRLYTAQWTDPGVRRVLANLATYMIFSDHEVTDDWNLSGIWVQQMLEQPDWPDLVVDALAAYWLYQGWGNLHPTAHHRDPRVALLRRHAGAGTDALAPLRQLLRARLHAPPAQRLSWQVRIPSSPPIFLLDTRCDRVLARPQRERGRVVSYTPRNDRIASQAQLDTLFAALETTDEPAILASAEPYLLPEPIWQLLRHVTRSWSTALQDLGNASPYALLEEIRRAFDADTWACYPASLDDLVERMARLARRHPDHPLIVLSGDTHYSYAMGKRFHAPGASPDLIMPRIIQLVSSPLRNPRSREGEERVLRLLRTHDERREQVGRLPGGASALATLDYARKRYRRAGAPRPGTDGHRFTWVADQALRDRRARQGVLFGNSIATMEISRDREELWAVWWNTRAGEARLIQAATFYERLT